MPTDDSAVWSLAASWAFHSDASAGWPSLCRVEIRLTMKIDRIFLSIYSMR